MAPNSHRRRAGSRRFWLAPAVGAIFAASFVSGALAQNAPVGIGAVVTPKAAFPLFEDSPGGLLSQTGRQLAVANPASHYKVTQARVFRNLLGAQYWVYLQPDGGGGGWALAGDGADPARNLFH